ncbi:MAG: ATP-binding protein [Kiritimatiellae bacterium]|nr:ATP-binding protein [Kiritimatiellia bacterium]
MNEERNAMLKYLRMGGLLANWDQTLAAAAKGRFSHVRLLDYVLEQEYKLKREHARQYRLLRAHIPEPLLMETFPFQNQPKLNRKAVVSLYDAFDYLPKAQNIIWIGPTGCGKTGLATAFLIDAINRGYSGRFVTFAELVGQLRAAGADYSESAVLKPFVACDCLVIDELGYTEIEPAQVGLFFSLMQRRHKKRPTLLTSNLGFDDWRAFLKNDHLTVALVDRLTANSYVFNMKNCRSLRPDPAPMP